MTPPPVEPRSALVDRSLPSVGTPRPSKRVQLRRIVRRLTGKAGRQQLMPLLIRVYAGFSTLDGEASEEEIESSLGFMRHDYPETMYSELRALYGEALRQPQDLQGVAEDLAGRLSHEEKVLLAVQLYVLITRSHSPETELLAFDAFMTRLGAANEAQGVVGQLHQTGNTAPVPAPTAVLDMLSLGRAAPADLVMGDLAVGYEVVVFRFQNLLLLKNSGDLPVIARGRQLTTGGFLRLYEGQRVVLGDVVLDYQDLVFYLNARKGVSSTQLYLGLNAAGSPFVERERTKLSAILLQFGLQVTATALKKSDIRINGRTLPKEGITVVSLADRIRFPDTSEITFAELRRRAREMGGRFDLNSGRTDYLVSNNPALLGAGDIILSPSLRSEILLRLRCDYEAKTGYLEVLKAARTVTVGRINLKERDGMVLPDGALISLGEGQYLRCRFSDRIIEEERNIIRELELTDVTHRFGRHSPAVEGISLTVRRGEMICVMGPSGSGKSSLLRILAGHLKPNEGSVQMNGVPLYENLAALCPFISYIPHEDAFDPLLTVEENLTAAAAIRSPHLQASDVARRVSTKLVELGLQARRSRLAGTPEQKHLSSGERKRLNVGMDMITPADVFLFDEPTSGLSSKDSEHILEIIRGLAHNKIVFVSIHQPSARLFALFHKAILLDNGGKLVYFGTPSGMQDYFREAWEDQLARPDDDGTAPRPDFNQPEFIFDVLETPLRDLSGDILYEEDARGHSAPARRFAPDFWQDRFQAHLVFSDAHAATAALQAADSSVQPRPVLPPSIDRTGTRNEGTRLGVMIRRAFLSKFRNRGNLITTLLEAPLLAVLIATVLRYSEDGNYTFASAFHIPTYLFLSLVVAMFLGLTNSADEIIRDRILLQRERNYNKNVTGYLLGKVLSLGAFALVQCVIYILIGNAVLEIHEMFLPQLMWMFATSLCGVTIGLAISSLVRDAKTALNLIPLILIPQIILGGALIKYEEMNKNLDLAYSIRRWISTDPESSEKPSNLKVPLICELMPLRWTYESLVLTQANHNPLAEAQTELNQRIRTLTANKTLSPGQESDLEHAKEALVKISGLEERNAAALYRRLSSIMISVRNGTYDPDAQEVRDRDQLVSAESVFENQKIRDLVSKAEMERRDFRRKIEPNVFFGTDKRYTLRIFGYTLIDLKTDTLSLNGTMIVLWILLPLMILWLVLRRQLRRV